MIREYIAVRGLHGVKYAGGNTQMHPLTGVSGSRDCILEQLFTSHGILKSRIHDFLDGHRSLHLAQRHLFTKNGMIVY